MSENSLVIFSNASKMLAEATTIQKVKEFKDLALTAVDFARRKGMGEQAVQYARNYALDAHRRMGELVKIEEAAGRLATRNRPNPGGRGGKNNVPHGYNDNYQSDDILRRDNSWMERC